MSADAATCIAAGLGSLAMGLWARHPVALAPGMGINAYFAYGVVIGMGDARAGAVLGALAEAIGGLQVARVAGDLVEIDESQVERSLGPIRDFVFGRVFNLPIRDAFHVSDHLVCGGVCKRRGKRDQAGCEQGQRPELG